MTASNTYGIRMKPADEKILLALATHLDRSLPDTVRYSLRKVAREEGLLPEKQIPDLGEIQEFTKKEKT